MSNLSKYRKFIVALVGAGVLFLQLMGQDNDLISTVIAVATALGVYQVPNDK